MRAAKRYRFIFDFWADKRKRKSREKLGKKPNLLANALKVRRALAPSSNSIR